jgi:hypothetical protein
MKTKLTAVEWLHKILATSSQEEIVGMINIWFMEAKAMEKEQIIDAWDNGMKSDNGHFGTKEQYYNETYGN